MGPGWGDQETPNGAGLSLESHWASWAQHRPHKPGSDTQGSETEQTPMSDWRQGSGTGQMDPRDQERGGLACDRHKDT